VKYRGVKLGVELEVDLSLRATPSAQEPPHKPRGERDSVGGRAERETVCGVLGCEPWR